MLTRELGDGAVAGAGTGSMGLGKLAWIGNTSAMCLVCVLFAYMMFAGLQQAQEDRRLFRESIEKIHADNREIWTELHNLVGEVRRLADRPAK